MTSSALTGNTSGLASATSPGLVGITTQTFAGKKTLDGGALINGDSAGTTITAGYIGYQVRSRVDASAPVTLTTGTWTDIISGGISLGVGTWDISAIAGFNYPSTAPTGTRCILGIGTVVGNSSTGVVSGDSRVELPLVPNANSDVMLTISQYRVIITSGTVPQYLKAFANFTAGTMSAYGRISAVLVG
jgi:hypothetical protein